MILAKEPPSPAFIPSKWLCPWLESRSHFEVQTTWSFFAAPCVCLCLRKGPWCHANRMSLEKNLEQEGPICWCCILEGVGWELHWVMGRALLNQGRKQQCPEKLWGLYVTYVCQRKRFPPPALSEGAGYRGMGLWIQSKKQRHAL